MWERDPGISTLRSCKPSVFLKPPICSHNSPLVICTEIKEGIKKKLIWFKCTQVETKVITGFDYTQVMLAYLLSTSYFSLYLLLPHFPAQLTFSLPMPHVPNLLGKQLPLQQVLQVTDHGLDLLWSPQSLNQASFHSSSYMQTHK